ncbi:tetratricopeptide repeat protein [Thiogranum longum]|uniref:Tetratricopeptide repeat protein n=1 Tax=Thiogranum longum TaxID=1537524 RepID=A0A4R1HB20_9GAMM|nr:tetratricopeptide repeat protein [Thiogranum longum]TCK17703.1 tetratricopeptide repeat protein [Thiogranum longum]
MKFSNTYLFYPVNKALELSIANTIARLGDALADVAAPDTSVTAADNFLYTRGNYEQHRFSSNVLDSAREALEANLTDEYREQAPLAWAEARNSLGNILAAQGQQLRDVELYEKAIQCFNNALEVFNQEESPLDWAATQNNLGTAKQALGRQLDNAKLLKESSDAYTSALLVWSRKETPEEWASAMHQLGATFHTYGRFLKGNRTFQKSVVAYKNAIAEFDADNNAFELAATHNNCGAVLHHLAESEENAERLEEAIRSYETALTVCMEQQLPIHLAVLCRVNKSTARSVLAELTKDASLTDEVADEFELIIECFPHALQPLCLKHCEEQISKAKCPGTVD